MILKLAHFNGHYATGKEMDKNDDTRMYNIIRQRAKRKKDLQGTFKYIKNKAGKTFINFFSGGRNMLIFKEHGL